MDIVTYKLSQKYADKVAAGFSSVRVDGLNIIFTLNDGKTATVAVPAPKDGVSITNVSLNQQNHLICTLSDGTAIDAGLVPQGVDGRDAKINGVNTLTIEAGDNITLDQEGNVLTINSTGGGSGGTSNYNALTNKPKINNVELNGNKTSSDLGLQPAGNYVTDTDYATEIKAGLVRIDPEFLAFVQETGILCALSVSYDSYEDMYPSAFISKGTLENVITGKNLYSKPSGGIPKTDLASTVQTSLNKADTAIQEHQDISGKANKISVVQTSASTIEINPNTFYKFGEVASLNITLASITDNTIYNEYMFEFVSGTTATTLTLPSSIKWLETPTIDANKIYQCSIVDNVGLLVGVTNV